MAYTSIIPVRRLDSTVNYVMNKEKTTAVSLEDAIDYAANRSKTEQSCYETAFACTLESAFADMRHGFQIIPAIAKEIEIFSASAGFHPAIILQDKACAVIQHRITLR